MVVERIMFAKTDTKVIGCLYFYTAKVKTKAKEKNTSHYIKLRRKTDLKVGS